MQAGRIDPASSLPSWLSVGLARREDLLTAILHWKGLPHCAEARFNLKEAQDKLVKLNKGLSDCVAGINQDRLGFQAWLEVIKSSGYSCPEKKDRVRFDFPKPLAELTSAQRRAARHQSQKV